MSKGKNFISGTTRIGDWRQSSDDAITVQVEFPENGMGNPGRISCNLVCDSRPQPPTSDIRVMNPSEAGFIAYLQAGDGGAISADEAKSMNWRVDWTLRR